MSFYEISAFEINTIDQNIGIVIWTNYVPLIETQIMYIYCKKKEFLSIDLMYKKILSPEFKTGVNLSRVIHLNSIISQILDKELKFAYCKIQICPPKKREQKIVWIDFFKYLMFRSTCTIIIIFFTKKYKVSDNFKIRGYVIVISINYIGVIL